MKNIKIIKGDITKLKIDVIVNAANKKLLRGSGVCGAIFKGAGPQLDEECAAIGECETGKAVITNAYNLPCKKIIHAVGPIYNLDLENAHELLESVYKDSLNLAELNNLESIAFPCISTGIYGYPKKEAAEIAYNTCNKFHSDSIKEIIFCCFDDENFEIYKEFL